jgi:hypothetical protein
LPIPQFVARPFHFNVQPKLSILGAIENEQNIGFYTCSDPARAPRVFAAKIVEPIWIFHSTTSQTGLERCVVTSVAHARLMFGSTEEPISE